MVRGQNLVGFWAIWASTRGLPFATLVVSNAGLLLGTRRLSVPMDAPRRRNRVLPWVIGLNLGVLMVLLELPWALDALHCSPLPPRAWAMAVALGVFSWICASALQRLAARSTADACADPRQAP